MQEVKLCLEFLSGPIFSSDLETGQTYTGIEAIDDNIAIREINRDLGQLYDSYYEFDSHGRACWFNEEKFHADREKLSEKLSELMDKLASVNDGSFVVKDEISPELAEHEE